MFDEWNDLRSALKSEVWDLAWVNLPAADDFDYAKLKHKRRRFNSFFQSMRRLRSRILCVFSYMSLFWLHARYEIFTSFSNIDSTRIDKYLNIQCFIIVITLLSRSPYPCSWMGRRRSRKKSISFHMNQFHTHISLDNWPIRNPTTNMNTVFDDVESKRTFVN